MGGPSYQRLSAQDSSFLMFEGAERHVHVTAVAIFDGGALITNGGGLDIDSVRAHVASRLHLLPTYRRRIAYTPMRSPIWVDDDRFDLRYHVRHTSLARPGCDEQLKELAGQIASVRLDRGRPLWELWFVEGLTEDRFAIIAKVHHSMVDGVSGVGVLTALLSTADDPSVAPAARWTPRRAPDWFDFVTDGAANSVRQSADALRTAVDVIQEPGRVARRVFDTAIAGWQTLSAAVNRPPELPFNRAIGSQRSIDWQGIELAEIRDLRKRLGGSVNDVVLTVVAGAMRRFLKSRRVRLRGSDLRVIVPVDTRSTPEDKHVANRVSAWAITLPTSERNPLRRFARIREQTTQRKQSNAELAIDLFLRFADWSGSTLLTAIGVRSVSLLQPYNLIVTNIHGPDVPLYLLGAPLREFIPALPLFENQGLAVTAMSYRDKMQIGLIGDLDVVPDLSRVATFLGESFRELRAAAENRH